jgi:ParD-like antitoxin of type II bacterial toxin-antitoxin system
MATMPTRIDRTLFEAAKAAGELHSRSAAQQLDHWARVGRELEASPAVTHDEIARVLAGQASYDTLTDRAQAFVRVSWNQRIAERIDTLDLADELRATGQPWFEADADGTVVVHEPGPASA